MKASAIRIPGRARQQGNAMLLVLLLTSTALGITSVAFRATDDAIRVEGFQRERDFRDEVITGALAGAAGLLRTAPPLTDPFRYVVPNLLADGSTFYTLVEIKSDPAGKKGKTKSYVVTAQRGTLVDALKYALPPVELGKDGKGKKKHKDKDKDKDNNGLGWGVGGIPPGADKGGHGDKD